VSIEELRELVAQRDSTIATQREDVSSLEAHIGALNQEIESVRHSGEEQVKRQAALISVRNAEVRSLAFSFHYIFVIKTVITMIDSQIGFLYSIHY
jgi:DNA repair exonuclease SbcCD ATPase subunit